jgi:hypothetical protein
VRQPRNLIGWLFLLANLGWAVNNTAAAWVESSSLVARLPGTTAAAWLATWPGSLSTAVYILIALLFPDGRALTPRWRGFARFVVAYGAIGALVTGFGAADVQSVALNGVIVGNPLALPGALGTVLGDLGAGPAPLGSIVLFAIAAGALVVRFRRSSGIERVQVKWLASAIALTAVTWLSTLPLEFAYQDLSVAPAWVRVWNVVSISVAMVIPMAAGMAILRHRLWDIDRIISRTISWTLVTGVIAVTFAVAVIALDALLADVTSGQALAVAASTLGAFALFQPLRSLVQRAVDRRFDRTRVDGQRTIDTFAGKLRDELDLPTLSAALGTAASTAFRPNCVTVWVRNVPGSRAARIS